MSRKFNLKQLVNRAYNGRKLTDDQWNTCALAWIEDNPTVSTEFVALFLPQFNWDKLWKCLVDHYNADSKMNRLYNEMWKGWRSGKSYKYLHRHSISHNNDSAVWGYLSICTKLCLYKYTETDWEDRMIYSIEALDQYICEYLGWENE